MYIPVPIYSYDFLLPYCVWVHHRALILLGVVEDKVSISVEALIFVFLHDELVWQFNRIDLDLRDYF